MSDVQWFLGTNRQVGKRKGVDAATRFDTPGKDRFVSGNDRGKLLKCHHHKAG